MISKDFSVRFTSFERSTDGTISLREYSPAERKMRGIKFSALLLLCAAAAVCVPVAHFILVPLLILASPIAGVFVAGRARVISGGEGICPVCGERVTVLPTHYVSMLTVTCVSCRRPIDIRVPTQ